MDLKFFNNLGGLYKNNHIFLKRQLWYLGKKCFFLVKIEIKIKMIEILSFWILMQNHHFSKCKIRLFTSQIKIN